MYNIVLIVLKYSSPYEFVRTLANVKNNLFLNVNIYCVEK